MSITSLIIAILLLVLVIGILLGYVYDSKHAVSSHIPTTSSANSTVLNQKANTTIANNSIAVIDADPNKYLGQQVTVVGGLSNSGTSYQITNNQGYNIAVVMPPGTRTYYSGSEYEVVGTFYTRFSCICATNTLTYNNSWESNQTLCEYNTTTGNGCFPQKSTYYVKVTNATLLN